MTIKPYIMSGTAVAMALLATTATAAQAAESNTYIGAHAGLNFPGDSTAKVDFGSGIVLNGTVDLDNGAEYGVVIGQRFGGWKLEGEVQRGEFKVASVSLGGTQVGSGANGNYLTLMLNGYRTVYLSETTALFAGAGIGWGRMAFPNIAFDPSCNCFPKAAKGGFAYQFRGGIQQSVSDNVEFFAQIIACSCPVRPLHQRRVSAIPSGILAWRAWACCSTLVGLPRQQRLPLRHWHQQRLQTPKQQPTAWPMRHPQATQLHQQRPLHSRFPSPSWSILA